MFKNYFLLSFFTLLYLVSHSQVIDDKTGKSYYYYDEATMKKVKEIYHFKQVVKIIPDKNNYGQYIDTMLYMKSGPYTRYYETGELECSGYYQAEKKDSIWKFYDIKGNLLRTEKWVNGRQMQ
jgi:antitoxin component YwqK of YwqJK toxin-antitoxin module